MQPAFVYDLGFVSRDASLSRRPEIVITMPTATYERLIPFIVELVEVNASRIHQYLPKKSWRFLQGEKGFVGHGSCCRLEQQNGGVQLYFELRFTTVRETVVTLVLFTYALRGGFSFAAEGEIKEGEKLQLLDITTYFNSTPHGYCPEGRTFPAFGCWLEKQSTEHGQSTITQVRGVLMEAWRAVAPRASRRFADECWCIFHEDGRFAIGCAGDACDMAIYPEGMLSSVAKFSARINSHNVESPHEQLTLIAGLAAMCGLARAEMDS